MHRVRDVRAAWRWRGGWVADAAIALAAAGLLVTVSAQLPVDHPDAQPLTLLGYALLVAAGVAVGMSRRWPRTAVGVVSVVLAVFVAHRYPNWPMWATGWVVLVALGLRTSWRTALVGAAGMLAVLTVVTAAFGSPSLLSLILVGWLAAAVFLGEALRNRRSYLAGLAERARFQQRTQEEEARRRIAEERLQIARDLHDSVAHAMSTINVQAGAAAHVLARRPEAAGEALGVIQRASGEVLDELTAMLAVLRDDIQQPDRGPTPGIGQIPRLAEAAGDSGLTVELSMEGPASAVPGVLGTAAYRVIQESLTNVARHSQATTATVRVAAGPGAGLTVEVADPGPPANDSAAGTGVGIRGMAERVASTGGRLQAGPAPQGGFLVRAVWEDSRDPRAAG